MPNQNQEDVECDVESSSKERNVTKFTVKEVAKKLKENFN